jgi:hypothetical protein
LRASLHSWQKKNLMPMKRLRKKIVAERVRATV